jgi:exodeoxyribonuclease V gamma subunit
MSLHLHLSAHSDELISKLRPALAAARIETLQQSTGIPRLITVLIPPGQLGEWLQVQLARDLGLSMGFEFLQPAKFLSRQAVAGERTFAESNAFWSPDNLRWLLLPKVESVAAQLGHATPGHISPRDRFAFAELLAQQLDRYSRHRPDLPLAWMDGRSALPASKATSEALADEQWQRELWCELATPEAPAHPSQWLSQHAQSLVNTAPLFVVGADLLDPLLLRTLQALGSQGHPVSLYLMLPSLGYLGDVTRRNALRQLLAQTPAPDDALELGGHPLIASLGQQAVGNFLLLSELTENFEAWPEPASQLESAPAGAGLLQRLQTDIRAQRTPPGAPTEPTKQSPDQAPPVDPRPIFDPSDLSLRIHSCHSPRRELEVLRDELLRAFTELDHLRPEEVLIAVTDFDTYAPLAEGILNGGSPSLRVRLTASPSREANPVTVALLALLRLSQGRHTASELIELLNLSAVQHQLDLVDEPESLTLLVDMIRLSGLTHDIDGTVRASGNTTGTWQAALDRHLAGAWLGPVAAIPDAFGVLVHPLAPDLHQADAVRLRFIGWLNQLACHQLLWGKEAPATEWASRLKTAVNELFSAPSIEEHTPSLFRLIGELKGVAADTLLDTGALTDWLQPALDNATSLRTTISGEITLGRLDQLHGLPCRVFALLGLQDGAFPRSSRRPAWDLLAHAPERWDADPRRQDRQWFLDTLLAPRDRLILTAANISLRSAHAGPLASCVDEVIRAANATVRPPAGANSLEKHLIVTHSIQPFDPGYFDSSGKLPRSFNTQAATIANDFQTCDSATVRPFQGPSCEPADQPSPADPISITLDQLIAFWKDPAKSWLRAVQIQTPETDDDDTELDDSPLQLNPLQSYSIHESALTSRLPGAKEAASAANSRLIADRALPPGSLGKLAWQKLDGEIDALAAELGPLIEKSKNARIDLTLAGGVKLTGKVLCGEPSDDHPSAWILVYRPGKYDTPNHQLGVLIATLAAAVQFKEPVACLACGNDKEKVKHLSSLDPAVAIDLLNLLVEGYRLGQRSPLCYSPATSAAMVPELKSENDAEALKSAAEAWSNKASRFSGGGEGNTPAARTAWRDTDPFAGANAAEWIKWGRMVAVPLNDWWNPPKPTTSAAAAATSAVTPGTPPKVGKKKSATKA